MTKSRIERTTLLFIGMYTGLSLHCSKWCGPLIAFPQDMVPSADLEGRNKGGLVNDDIRTQVQHAGVYRMSPTASAVRSTDH